MVIAIDDGCVIYFPMKCRLIEIVWSEGEHYSFTHKSNSSFYRLLPKSMYLFVLNFSVGRAKSNNDFSILSFSFVSQACTYLYSIYRYLAINTPKTHYDSNV